MAPAMCFPWVIALVPLGAIALTVAVWLVARSIAKSRQRGFPVEPPKDQDKKP